MGYSNAEEMGLCPIGEGKWPGGGWGREEDKTFSNTGIIEIEYMKIHIFELWKDGRMNK